MNIPIYEAYLNDGDEIQLISLVDKPAIERDFVAFNQEEVKQLQYFNEEQQMIVAPVMIPDKLILRNSEALGYFYTKFSKDTIEKIRYQYSKDGNFNNTNLNHKDSIDGLIMLESWIKESNDDKSNNYGFSDLPVGTWFVKYKVDNKEVWQKIKEGKINGVSIEGYISYAIQKFKKQDFENVLIDYFTNCGISQQQFEEEFAQADLIPYAEGDILPKDNKQGRTFYKYVGPTAERDFCKQMLGLKRLYTYEEVKGANDLAVNAGFGPNGTSTYDIWFYKGGPNCKHYWQKIYATLSTQQSKGPARGKAGTPMYDQPNRGYLKAQVLSIFDKKFDIVEIPAINPDSVDVIPVNSNDKPLGLNIYGYEFKYPSLAPEAMTLFSSFDLMNIGYNDEGMVRSAALQLDAILALENKAKIENSVSIDDLNEAIILSNDFKDLINQIAQRNNIVLDASFIDRHVQIIQSFLGQDEQFVILPKAGESQDEYIGRCVGIETNKGYESSQAAAICYDKWKNR